MLEIWLSVKQMSSFGDDDFVHCVNVWRKSGNEKIVLKAL
jgi:hypothetical protein